MPSAPAIPSGVEAEHAGRRRRRAERAAGGGRVEAAIVMLAGRQGERDPARHLVAGDDRGQHVGARGARHLARGQRRRDHRGAGMQRAGGVGVVEIERVAERAVEQARRRPACSARNRRTRRNCRRPCPAPGRRPAGQGCSRRRGGRGRCCRPDPAPGSARAAPPRAAAGPALIAALKAASSAVTPSWPASPPLRPSTLAQTAAGSKMARTVRVRRIEADSAAWQWHMHRRTCCPAALPAVPAAAAGARRRSAAAPAVPPAAGRFAAFVAGVRAEARAGRHLGDATLDRAFAGLQPNQQGDRARPPPARVHPDLGATTARRVVSDASGRRRPRRVAQPTARCWPQSTPRYGVDARRGRRHLGARIQLRRDHRRLQRRRGAGDAGLGRAGAPLLPLRADGRAAHPRPRRHHACSA